MKAFVALFVPNDKLDNIIHPLNVSLRDVVGSIFRVNSTIFLQLLKVLLRAVSGVKTNDGREIFVSDTQLLKV